MRRNLLRSSITLGVIAILSLSTSGCAIDRLLDASEPLEGSELDPREVSTREGAIRLQRSVVTSLAAAYSDVSHHTAVFTDELTISDIASGTAPVNIDARVPNLVNNLIFSSAYEKLHRARVRAAQAITLLRRYGTAQDSALIGETYALQAQAILFLGEMFCSGVPLTRVPFEGGLEYTPGIPTTQLFETAAALFDTAYQFGKDSLPIATLAKIGRGRALMNLHRYAEARTAVQGVATGDQYTVRYATVTGAVPFWSTPAANALVDVENNEGGTGLEWAAEPPAVQDPRVPLAAGTFRRQQKFTSAAVTVVLAKGAEARMIEAEALLQPANAPEGDWLAPINSARATIGLDPLTDPGSADARVDLLFRERAFWFFLEGHRLGDLRRLVRQYNRLAMTVYPTGAYPRGTWRTPAYGTEYVFAPPVAEETANPLYTGCIDRNP
jgi:hypothetical protein